MATWMITGASGWLGSRVLEALVQDLSGDDRVVALGRHRPDALRGALFVAADLLDPESIGRAVHDVRPDVVIHAAGKTPPSPDAEMYEANFWGTSRLLTAVKELKRPVRVVVAGSAAELGPIQPADLPVTEDHPCAPMTAYGRSKAMATAAATAMRGPVEVVVGRVFNLVGPAMPESLAFGRFASQLASPGADPATLLTGRLDSRRDFVDVRDAALALLALATQGTPGKVYNVASGSSRSIQEGLDLLVGLSGRAVRTSVDPAAMRRTEPDDTRASLDRITADTDWRPEIPFNRSIADLWGGVVSRVWSPLPLTA